MSPRSHRGFTLIEMLIAIGVIVLLVALTVTAAMALVRRGEVASTENMLKLVDLTITEFEVEADRKVSLGPVFDNDFNDCGIWDIRSETPVNLQTTFLIGKTMYRRDASREIFAQISPEFIVEFRRVGGVRPVWFTPEDDSYIGDQCFGDASPNPAAYDADLKWFALIDTWGQPVRTIYPGRVPDGRSFIGGARVLSDPATYPLDEDGSLLTDVELELGRCIGRRVAFVSAGPDGLFGDLHLDVSSGSLSDDQRLDVERAADNVYSYPINVERAP